MNPLKIETYEENERPRHSIALPDDNELYWKGTVSGPTFAMMYNHDPYTYATFALSHENIDACIYALITLKTWLAENGAP